MTDARRAVGAAGEDAVARWYTEAGYEVLGRNWRVREGEIDPVGPLVADESLGDAAKLELHCAIASVTLIWPAMIFFFASSAARMASGDTRVRLYSSTT